LCWGAPDFLVHFDIYLSNKKGNTMRMLNFLGMTLATWGPISQSYSSIQLIISLPFLMTTISHHPSYFPISAFLFSFPFLSTTAPITYSNLFRTFIKNYLAIFENFFSTDNLHLRCIY
jgi:hypothetical protein